MAGEKQIKWIPTPGLTSEKSERADRKFRIYRAMSMCEQSEIDKRKNRLSPRSGVRSRNQRADI
jgi:hypothetical protein